jgi:hypothetical protein
LQNEKIHKNVECFESKFSFFLGQIWSWNVYFWPKTNENTVFSKFRPKHCFGCQNSDRKIVGRQTMRSRWHKQAPQARAACCRAPWIVSILKKFNSQTMHPRKCHSKKCLKGKLCISCDTSKRRRCALRTVVHCESWQSAKV